MSNSPSEPCLNSPASCNLLSRSLKMATQSNSLMNTLIMPSLSLDDVLPLTILVKPSDAVLGSDEFVTSDEAGTTATTTTILPEKSQPGHKGELVGVLDKVSSCYLVSSRATNSFEFFVANQALQLVEAFLVLFGSFL